MYLLYELVIFYPHHQTCTINTTFGNKLQKFCSSVLDGYASTTSGIDIEFVDLIDGRRKYCQIKAGPNTINKDEVKTIYDHFLAVKNLARTNNLNIGFNDLIVGVFYEKPNELSGHYKKIQANYPVYIGNEFWYRLTGDENRKICINLPKLWCENQKRNYKKIRNSCWIYLYNLNYFICRC